MLPVAPPRRRRMKQTPTLDIKPERDPLATIAVSAAPVLLAGRYRLLMRALWQLRHSRRTRWGLGVGSGAVMLLLAFLAVRHFATTSWPLSRGQPGLLVAAGLLLLLAQALKALGWARLFTNRERPSPLALVAGNGGAALIGVVLPGRFDDAMRIAVVRRYPGCPASGPADCLPVTSGLRRHLLAQRSHLPAVHAHLVSNAAGATDPDDRTDGRESEDCDLHHVLLLTLRRRQRLVFTGAVRGSGSVDKDLATCPKFLCRDLALGEATFEDLNRPFLVHRRLSGRPVAPRGAADEPKNAKDDRAPEQHHHDHHQRHPAPAPAAMHPCVRRRNGLRDVHLSTSSATLAPIAATSLSRCSNCITRSEGRNGAQLSRPRVTMAKAIADAMQSARPGRDPDDGVGRAKRRDSCGQHDPGDDEQDDATDRARAEKERHQDGDRRDDERQEPAIKNPHVRGHDDHAPRLVTLLHSFPLRFPR